MKKSSYSVIGGSGQGAAVGDIKVDLTVPEIKIPEVNVRFDELKEVLEGLKVPPPVVEVNLPKQAPPIIHNYPQEFKLPPFPEFPDFPKIPAPVVHVHPQVTSSIRVTLADPILAWTFVIAIYILIAFVSVAAVLFFYPGGLSKVG